MSRILPSVSFNRGSSLVDCMPRRVVLCSAVIRAVMRAPCSQQAGSSARLPCLAVPRPSTARIQAHSTSFEQFCPVAPHEGTHPRLPARIQASKDRISLSHRQRYAVPFAASFGPPPARPGVDNKSRGRGLLSAGHRRGRLCMALRCLGKLHAWCGLGAESPCNTKASSRMPQRRPVARGRTLVRHGAGLQTGVLDVLAILGQACSESSAKNLRGPPNPGPRE